MNSLFGDFFRDFWPGFLALDQNGDGTDGRDGRDGRTGRTGRTDGIQFYSTTGTEKYSFRVLLESRNTVLEYYLLFTIYFLKNPKTYFR